MLASLCGQFVRWAIVCDPAISRQFTLTHPGQGEIVSTPPSPLPTLSRIAVLLALICLAPALVSRGVAAVPDAPTSTQDDSCESAGAQAERDRDLPPGLLTAIGRMESGRYDPGAGRVSAWPWTINAAGQGAFFATKQQAIAAVAALRMRGIQSIDVGCFQINLMYHAAAFASLDEAFDVHANASYAARFLSDLHGRGGSWETAVAWYHSATPELGEPYRDRVLADWTGGGMRIGIRTAVAAPPRSDPHVLSFAATLIAVRVWTPAAPATAATASTAIAAPPLGRMDRLAAVTPAKATGSWRSTPTRLPRVITPSG